MSYFKIQASSQNFSFLAFKGEAVGSIQISSSGGVTDGNFIFRRKHVFDVCCCLFWTPDPFVNYEKILVVLRQ
jgi:hypothetical protein